jgi:tetratricopeptide (TPR) repeat protein
MKKNRKQTIQQQVSSEKKLIKGSLFKEYPVMLAVIASVVAFILYVPSLQNNFISNWDDNRYLLENSHIKSMGLNFFTWAFLDYKTNLWHPITWISHALDYALWDLNPFGHHLTSVVLNSLNTGIVVILSFLLLKTVASRNDAEECQVFTDRRDLLVAAGISGLLFAIHPLHVESVAWVAERKDLLYSLFYMLSIICYLRYAASIERDEPTLFYRNRHYLWALGLFALSLGSKPMAITLPLVCLILDWYPLRRVQTGKLISLLVEKVPFLALSLLVSIVTVMAQKEVGGLKTLTEASFAFRIMLAFKSLLLYLVKVFLPVGLLPLYPYPKDTAPFKPEYLGALLLILVLTILCLFYRKRRPYFAAVWFFFVITLLPILGIMQAGIQSMADRFAYLASFGPLLLAAVGLTMLWRKVQSVALVRELFVAAAFVVVFLLVNMTVLQIAIWKDAVTLWSYMIKSSPDYAETYQYRGQAFQKIGRLDSAIDDFSRCIALDPAHVEAFVNRGMSQFGKGEFDKAIEDFDRAIALNPKEVVAYTNRGNAYAQQGVLSRAKEDFSRAIAIKPFYPAYINRGLVTMDEGDFTKAAADFTEAIKLQPDFPDVYPVRGDAYMKMGRIDLALQDYSQACSMGVQAACDKATSPFQRAK